MKELRKITQEQLKEVLLKHKLYLENKEGGEKADLSYCDLIGANLECANLIGANLGYTYLEGAVLEGANLEGANLEDAILKKANLTNTILQDTIVPMRNKEDIKEEVKVLETDAIDFNRIFDILKYAIDNKNVNEIIVIEDKTEIKIKK